ncbi:MAG: hypothetical protein ACE5HE_08480, partial [Phycisphaerae bacterium]
MAGDRERTSMIRPGRVGVVWPGVLVAVASSIACAQPAASEDAIIRPIQRLSTIAQGDQRRI